MRHVVLEHDEVAGDGHLGLRPPDAVDGRDAALKQEHPVDAAGQLVAR